MFGHEDRERDDTEQEPASTLYRFEYLYEGDRLVDWVWLYDAQEVHSYRANEDEVSAMTWRQSTFEEQELYEEAFADGHGLGIAETRMETNNGVFFRMVGFNLDDGLKTVKIFTCGECKREHLEFEWNAAKQGDYYLAKEKDGVLWHLCLDCTIV